MLIMTADKIRKLKELDKDNVNLSDIEKVFPNLGDTDENGLTLLHWVIQNGLKNLSRVLATSQRAEAVDIAGNTPLHLAAKRYVDTLNRDIYGDIVEQLIGHCSFHVLMSKNNEGKAPWEYLNSIPKPMDNYLDYYLSTWVFDAVEKGGDDGFAVLMDELINEKVKLLKYINREEVFFNFTEKGGERAINLIKILLDKQIITSDYIKNQQDSQDYSAKDRTALVAAVEVGDFEFVKGLLNLGIYTVEEMKSYKDDRNNTFFYYAIKSGKPEFLDWFLSITTNFLTQEEKINFIDQCKEKFPEYVTFELYRNLGLNSQACDFVFSIIIDQSANQADKDQARLNIADLIFMGEILLEGFPNHLKVSENPQDETEFDKLDKETKNNIILDRVIQAYHYLCDNTLPNAVQLRERFDAILAGDYSGQQVNQPWTSEALNKFRQYYQNFYDHCPRELLTILVRQQDSRLNQMEQEKLRAVQPETKERSLQTSKREREYAVAGVMADHAKRIKIDDLNASQDLPQQQ